MRAVWIDAGNNPNSDLLRKYGVKRCYWPSHVADGSGGFEPNPTLTEEYLEGWRKGFEVGIYTARNWLPGILPQTLARAIDARLTALNQTRKQCAVHANLEKSMGCDPAYVAAFVEEFRAVRPLRELAWVVEGIQGGNFTRDLLVTLSYYNVSVVAENFTGSMAPMSADEIRSNLVNYGVDRARALVMYDAARLSPFLFWDGCAFTQGRLA